MNVSIILDTIKFGNSLNNALTMKRLPAESLLNDYYLDE